MDHSPNLALPFIAQAQAQKHVTHNEALTTLDAVVQIGVIDRDLGEAPASPVDGARYIVGPGATGIWTGRSGDVASFQDGGWLYHVPRGGWLAWIADEERLVVWHDGAWIDATGVGEGLNAIPLVGINATADATNRLTVASAATLFDHDTSGGHQHKINKATAADTASMLFQTAYGGRAEIGTSGDDDLHVKVSPDGVDWHEAIVVDRGTGEVSFPNTTLDGAATQAVQPVLNPYLRRPWAKLGAILRGEANARLNVVTLGDSVMPLLRELIEQRMKLEWVNGGIAGRLSGETGFGDDGNGTSITQVTGDFTHSPNGAFWNLASGGSKYFQVGNPTNDNPLPEWHNQVALAPAACTRIGVWFTRRSGGGTFKVQTSTKTQAEVYTDVTGLTAVDTSGATGLVYQEVTVAAIDASRIRFVHVSGGDCYVVGALVAASSGIVFHNWHVGGLALTDMVASTRFAELASATPADMIMTSFLDSPGDSSGSTGLTVAEMIDTVIDGIRDAFPATVSPANASAWNGTLADTIPLAARRAPLVLFGANRVSNSGAVDQDAYDAALRANAETNGDCFVDTARIMGAWREAWDLGLMSNGDGPSTSTHPRTFYFGAVATVFLRETGFIGGAFMRPLAQPRHDRVQVGPARPGVEVGGVAFSNRANRFKAGDNTTQFSAGPLDLVGFGDIAAMIQSSGSVFECGLVFNSTAANGRRYLITSQPGGGFILRDITATGRNFLQYNAAQQLNLGTSSGDSINIGPKSNFFTGIRHGTVALTAGQATVSNAVMTANARVVVTRSARGGTPGVTYEVAPGAGSFTITSRDAADAIATSDTSTISYVVVEP